jgi:tRNA (cytidine/uridine-2'-O-)-methyltransferase
MLVFARPSALLVKKSRAARVSSRGLCWSTGMARVFLHAPQDFRNLCAISRTLEVFGHAECFVFDPRRLVRERYGKSRAREQRVVSAGAFAKIRWHRVEEPQRFLSEHAGRVVATVAEPGACVLTRYRFEPSDLLLFGSEAQGLPAAVVASCAGQVTIPAHGRTQSLNLAVALGVVLFECERQLDPTRWG